MTATDFFSYPSVIGMLHYLNHTIPDYAFVIHQCTRCTFEPKVLHEVAPKPISRYLKGTMNKGLVLGPSDDWILDCLLDIATCEDILSRLIYLLI